MVRSIKQFRNRHAGPRFGLRHQTGRALDKLKANRENLGAADELDAIEPGVDQQHRLRSAQADKISGMANLAAQAGLDRINAARKVQSANDAEAGRSAFRRPIDQVKNRGRAEAEILRLYDPAVPHR